MKFKKAILSEDGHITTFLAGERLSDPANVRVPTSVAAAAPELLEALERLNVQAAILTSALAGDDMTRPETLVEEARSVLRSARAAIRKAKGTL